MESGEGQASVGSVTAAAVDNKNLTDEEILKIDVKSALEEHLAPEKLEIKADVGCGGSAKLEIFIVSAKFEGLPLLKRHRAVQQAVCSIRDYQSRVHAITITKSLTPAQYQQQQ